MKAVRDWEAKSEIAEKSTISPWIGQKVALPWPKTSEGLEFAKFTSFLCSVVFLEIILEFSKSILFAETM